jgi:hypothetical protein
MRPIRSALPRRVLLAAPALLTLPALAQVPRTPAQMEGPYYPRTSPADADAVTAGKKPLRDVAPKSSRKKRSGKKAKGKAAPAAPATDPVVADFGKHWPPAWEKFKGKFADLLLELSCQYKIIASPSVKACRQYEIGKLFDTEFPRFVAEKHEKVERAPLIVHGDRRH